MKTATTYAIFPEIEFYKSDTNAAWEEYTTKSRIRIEVDEGYIFLTHVNTKWIPIEMPSEGEKNTAIANIIRDFNTECYKSLFLYKPSGFYGEDLDEDKRTEEQRLKDSYL